jgi:hypothetical protein
LEYKLISAEIKMNLLTEIDNCRRKLKAQKIEANKTKP